MSQSQRITKLARERVEDHIRLVQQVIEDNDATNEEQHMLNRSAAGLLPYAVAADTCDALSHAVGRARSQRQLGELMRMHQAAIDELPDAA